MFGGAGLFRDGVMFVLLDDRVISLRVADTLRATCGLWALPWRYFMKRDCAARDMGLRRHP